MSCPVGDGRLVVMGLPVGNRTCGLCRVVYTVFS